MDSISSLRADIYLHNIFGFDLEAKSKTSRSADAKIPKHAEITHIAIASKNRKACFKVTKESVALLVELLTTPKFVGLVYNSSYDLAVLHLRKILPIKQVRARIIDVLVLAWLRDEEIDHGLKSTVQLYLNHKMVTYKEATESSPTHRALKRIKTLRGYFELGLAKAKTRRPLNDYNAEPWSKVKLKKHLLANGFDGEGVKAELAMLFGEEYLEGYKVHIAEMLPKLAAEELQLTLRAEEEFRQYACDDAAQLIRLYSKLVGLVSKEVPTLWTKIELAVRMSTLNMELDGVTIDKPRMEEFKKTIEPLMVEFEANIYNIAKQEFNTGSPDQMRKVLFEDLGLMPPVFRVHQDRRLLPKLTPAGMEWVIRNHVFLDLRDPKTIPEEVWDKYLSTDSVVLERIAHPIGQAILNYRSIAKLHSTYVEATLQRLLETADNKLHGRFNSVGTDTGRFSSSGPNLQNIPSRNKPSTYDERIQKIGPKIREAFIASVADSLAPEGYDLVVADHSQVELRLIAHISQDPRMLSTYLMGAQVDDIFYYTGDIHSSTQKALQIPRKLAKNVNFGFNYGMMPEKFARQIKLYKPGTIEYDIVAATTYRNGYFATYPGISRVMETLRKGWYKHKIRDFSTISGRKRHFHDERVSAGKILNAKVQGSSADLLKVAIFIIEKYVIPAYPGTKLLLQVHDELVYETPKRFSSEVGLLIKYVMEYAWFSLKVPVLASAKVCDNWSAKDSDDIAEIGQFYAMVDGKDRVFDANNWAEYREIEENKPESIKRKSSVAMLTPKHLDFCKTVVPDLGPIFTKRDNSKILSRSEVLQKRESEQLSS